MPNMKDLNGKAWSMESSLYSYFDQNFQIQLMVSYLPVLLRSYIMLLLPIYRPEKHTVGLFFWLTQKYSLGLSKCYVMETNVHSNLLPEHYIMKTSVCTRVPWSWRRLSVPECHDLDSSLHGYRITRRLRLGFIFMSNQLPECSVTEMFMHSNLNRSIDCLLYVSCII